MSREGFLNQSSIIAVGHLINSCSLLSSSLSQKTMDNQTFAQIEKNMTSKDSHMGPVEEFPDSSHAGSETGTMTPPGEWTPRPGPRTDRAVTDHLRQLFDHCIQQVSRLETKRNELIQELLGVQESIMRVVGHLRGKLVETQRLLTLAQLDYVAVYEDVKEMKRKLFAAARDCIQSQVTLAQREYEVAQSAVTQVGTTG